MTLPHLVLVGATATGKSATAMDIARRCSDVEIVTVDSMQVYRGMDIGTAKPTNAEQAEVRHHALDLVDPTEEFSVATFQDAVRHALAAIEDRGGRAVLVGGTGLYVRAIVDELQLPGQWPDVRAELEAETDTAALHRRLAELDPVAAIRMTDANRRRIVRALEVTIGSGRAFSSYGPGLETYPPLHRFRMVGLALPRDVLAERIAARVERMVADGLVEEVKELATLYGTRLSRTARQALGYRELLDWVEGHVSFDDAIAAAIQRTRQFAVRQERWFRRDPRITWRPGVDGDANTVAVAEQVLGDWRAA